MAHTPVWKDGHCRPFERGIDQFNTTQVRPWSARQLPFSLDSNALQSTKIRYCDINAQVVGFVELPESSDIYGQPYPLHTNTPGVHSPSQQQPHQPHNRQQGYSSPQQQQTPPEPTAVFYQITVSGTFLIRYTGNFTGNASTTAKADLYPITIEYTIYRRFSEFRNLHSAIEEYYFNIPQFPPREAFSKITPLLNATPDPNVPPPPKLSSSMPLYDGTRAQVWSFYHKRMLQLSAYLQAAILRVPALIHSEQFHNFFALHKHFVLDTSLMPRRLFRTQDQLSPFGITDFYFCKQFSTIHNLSCLTEYQHHLATAKDTVQDYLSTHRHIATPSATAPPFMPNAQHPSRQYQLPQYRTNNTNIVYLAAQDSKLASKLDSKLGGYLGGFQEGSSYGCLIPLVYTSQDVDGAIDFIPNQLGTTQQFFDPGASPNAHHNNNNITNNQMLHNNNNYNNNFHDHNFDFEQSAISMANTGSSGPDLHTEPFVHEYNQYDKDPHNQKKVFANKLQFIPPTPQLPYFSHRVSCIEVLNNVNLVMDVARGGFRIVPIVPVKKTRGGGQNANSTSGNNNTTNNNNNNSINLNNAINASFNNNNNNNNSSTQQHPNVNNNTTTTSNTTSECEDDLFVTMTNTIFVGLDNGDIQVYQHRVECPLGDVQDITSTKSLLTQNNSELRYMMTLPNCHDGRVEKLSLHLLPTNISALTRLENTLCPTQHGVDMLLGNNNTSHNNIPSPTTTTTTTTTTNGSAPISVDVVLEKNNVLLHNHRHTHHIHPQDEHTLQQTILSHGTIHNAPPPTTATTTTTTKTASNNNSVTTNNNANATSNNTSNLSNTSSSSTTTTTTTTQQQDIILMLISSSRDGRVVLHNLSNLRQTSVLSGMVTNTSTTAPYGPIASHNFSTESGLLYISTFKGYLLQYCVYFDLKENTICALAGRAGQFYSDCARRMDLLLHFYPITPIDPTFTAHSSLLCVTNYYDNNVDIWDFTHKTPKHRAGGSGGGGNDTSVLIPDLPHCYPKRLFSIPLLRSQCKVLCTVPLYLSDVLDAAKRQPDHIFPTNSRVPQVSEMLQKVNDSASLHKPIALQNVEHIVAKHPFVPVKQTALYYLFTGHANGFLGMTIFNVYNGKYALLYAIGAHRQEITQLRYDQERHMVVTASADKTMAGWEIPNVVQYIDRLL